MKTAISVPDEVFSAGENLAKRLKLSRSELYSRALREFVDRHSADVVTASWNSAIAEIDQDAEASTASARAIFERVEW